MSGDTFGCHNWKEVVAITDIQWVKDVAKHPTMHRTTPVQRIIWPKVLTVRRVRNSATAPRPWSALASPFHKGDTQQPPALRSRECGPVSAGKFFYPQKWTFYSSLLTSRPRVNRPQDSAPFILHFLPIELSSYLSQAFYTFLVFYFNILYLITTHLKQRYWPKA